MVSVLPSLFCLKVVLYHSIFAHLSKRSIHSIIHVFVYLLFVPKPPLQTTDKATRSFSLCVSGDVFCVICAADAYEHAVGVPLHRDRGSGRAAVQLLPPLV